MPTNEMGKSCQIVEQFMNKITLNSVNSDCQKICRHLADFKVVVTS